MNEQREEQKRKEIKLLNPSKKPLTVEKLKTFKGLEKLSEKVAQEIVEAIHQLANILTAFYKAKKKKNT